MFITDTPPKHCPDCGHSFTYDNLARADFYAGASSQCPDCQTMFQHAPADAITTAAKPHGDLHQYA